MAHTLKKNSFNKEESIHVQTKIREFPRVIINNIILFERRLKLLKPLTEVNKVFDQRLSRSKEQVDRS